MASPARRALSDAATRRNAGSFADPGTADLTSPTYLTRPALGSRQIKVLSGRGTFAPGYTIIGDQANAQAEGIVVPRILKMVSPLTGQGPVSPLATGRYYGMDYSVLSPRIVRVAKSVAPNTGSKVVRPKMTAIRRLDSRGSGTVSYV